MMPPGPFGKTFAPTAAASAEAQQTNPLAGEQQAVKVLRFKLPVGNPNAPSADALLQPKLDTNVNADHAVLTSVLRAMLGPGAPAFQPAPGLTMPMAGSPSAPGSVAPVSVNERSDNGPSVSGASGGSSVAQADPGPDVSSLWSGISSGYAATPNIAFSGGRGNDVPLPPQINSTLSEAPGLGGPFDRSNVTTPAAPIDLSQRRPWMSGGPF